MVGAFVGDTPLRALFAADMPPGVQLLAKLEWHQHGRSMAARPAYQLIREAVLAGQLTAERGLLFPGGGPLALAYASICARLHLPFAVCLPAERPAAERLSLQALGAELHQGAPDLKEAQAQAQELAAQAPDRYYLALSAGQEAAWKAHYYHTAREIYHQTQGGITHFVAGPVPSAAFYGTGRKLREVNPGIQLVARAALPQEAPHPAGPDLYPDASLVVEPATARAWAIRAAREEGLLISPAGAANLAAAADLAHRLSMGIVVTLLPDDGSLDDRWLQTLATS